jgi:SAM-dependent methyltransferase
MGATARWTKAFARKVLPRSAVVQIRGLKVALHRRELRAAEAALRDAPQEPVHLDPAMLAELHDAYEEPDEYPYDPDTLAARGAARARELLRLPGGGTASTFLEIGCWDGMVSAAISRRGRNSTAVDNRSAGFDQRARDCGVELLTMDGASLDFADHTFDFVFSYDAFEHFEDPAAVLGEMERVVKPGGRIYARFGPLYLSPYGEHAYRSVALPYCQVLFADDDLNAFCRSRGVRAIDFGHVNRWRTSDYRDLWKRHARLRPIIYREIRNVDHLDLVLRFPSCFRAATTDIDDLTVASIEVLFEKS